jgi:ribosomal 30S subunit maturation factor RimM
MAHLGNHIGTLIKPHGYKGELLLRGKPQFLNKITKGIPLFIEIYEQRIPFFIKDFSLDISGQKGIIKFEFIDSDLEARKYVSCDVFFDSDKLENQEETIHINEYVGFTVIDSIAGIEYKVIDFYESAENPILVLENSGAELLLPRNADYILEIDHVGKIMKVEFPEGLTE